MPTSAEPILVKRYARSRLYDTVGARYLTTGDLRDWRARGVAFVVREAESAAEITQVLLAEPR